MKRRRTHRRAEGFSLLEVAVAIVILALSALALLTATQAGNHVNNAGRKISIAAFLTQEIREWTLKLPFSDPDPGDQGNPPGPDGSDPNSFVDDLDDMLAVTYRPPRDAAGTPISDLGHWAQKVSLSWRDPNNLAVTVADGNSAVVHVSVEILCNDESVLKSGWLVTGE